MKRFIVSILCVSVFFIGLGGLVDRVGATFKSDDKALNLLRAARQAIGGDTAVAGVKSMTILGKATKTFEIDGAARTEQGDFEINFELPNKMSRMMKLRTESGNGTGETQVVEKKVDLVVVGGGEGGNLQWKVENPDGVKTIIVKKADGTTEQITTDGKEPIILERKDGDKAVFTSEDEKNLNGDGKKVFIRKEAGGLTGGDFQQFELFRTTLSLLLTAPEGVDVSYTYAGEGSVDGASCDIIDAAVGGKSVKLYLDKSTHLPRMMNYQGIKPFIIKIRKDEAKPETNGDTKTFTRQLAEPETAEFQVKFSDYRNVGGLQLPFRWTQTVGGKDDEVTDITSYEINPAGIAEKFDKLPQKIMLRTKKPE